MYRLVRFADLDDQSISDASLFDLPCGTRNHLRHFLVLSGRLNDPTSTDFILSEENFLPVNILAEITILKCTGRKFWRGGLKQLWVDTQKLRPRSYRENFC